MTLQDIFDHLASGELSQIFAGSFDEEGNAIAGDQRKRVFLPVRMALTELHKRFLLREVELTVALQEEKQSYVLDPRFAESNSGSGVKFILDAKDPFLGDIFRIERVMDEHGNELALNQVDNPHSFRTGAYNTLLVPDDYKGEQLKVVCRGDHPPINEALALAAPSVVQIELPATYLWALVLFVAYRVLNPAGAVGEFHEGNNYLTKFESECFRLKDQNFELDRQNDVPRFVANGWV